MKRLRVSLLVVLMSLLAMQALGDLKKEATIWVARDVAPSPKVRLTINTRNVPVVRMAAYRLHDIQTLINRESLVGCPAAKGRPTLSWSVNLVSARESRSLAQRDAYRNRQVNLPPLSPGIYLLTAGGAR